MRYFGGFAFVDNNPKTRYHNLIIANSEDRNVSANLMLGNTCASFTARNDKD